MDMSAMGQPRKLFIVWNSRSCGERLSKENRMFAKQPKQVDGRARTTQAKAGRARARAKTSKTKARARARTRTKEWVNTTTRKEKKGIQDMEGGTTTRKKHKPVKNTQSGTDTSWEHADTWTDADWWSSDWSPDFWADLAWEPAARQLPPAHPEHFNVRWADDVQGVSW